MGPQWGVGYDVDSVRPGDEDWVRLVVDVDGNREAIELARAGTEKPHLGGMLGNLAGEENPNCFPWGWNLLHDMRDVVRLLDGRCARGGKRTRRCRAIADVEAMMRIAEQLCEPPVQHWSSS